MVVERIISNLQEASDIVLSAQNLVNEQFNKNANILSGQEKKNSFDQKLNQFLNTIKKSTFLSAEEKNLFTNLMPVEVYQKAREIILKLTAQEIKNPLTK